MPCANIFFQQLITYINRVLIIKQEDFVNGILHGELTQRGFTFTQFVEAWLTKMDLIVSWEAHRIKTLAILTLLPHLNGELIRQAFGEIARLTFDKLEHELYLKVTNNDSRFDSPTRFENPKKADLTRNPNTVKIRIHERISQRYEALKRDDWLISFDLIDILWQKTRELMSKLGIQSIDPLLECLPEEN